MPTIPLPWLKLDHRYLEDPQLGSIPPLSQLMYFKLYMLAHQCQADGLITLSTQEICWKLHITEPELNAAIKDLTRIQLFKLNGRGPEITRYLADGNVSLKDRKNTDERVKRFREDKKKRTSNASSNTNVTPRESESESESESEKEKESESSHARPSTESQSRTPIQLAADRLIDNISISFLIPLLKIQGKFIKQVKADPAIYPADLLAEYTRLMAKTGIDKPGSITAMNLLRHEYPPDNYYTFNQWDKHLPNEIKEAIAIDSLNGKRYITGECSESINH